MAEQPVFVFDADGVVIEPWGFAKHLEKQFKIVPEQTQAFFAGPFLQCLTGHAELRPSLLPFLHGWGWQRSMDEFIDTWMSADDLPDEDVLAQVATLKEAGYTCCLASNQEVTRADYVTHQMGFGGLFDHLFFSCHLGAMKPDPLFYEKIEQTLGVSGDQVVFVDDSQGHVESARAAGWQAIHFQSISDIDAVLRHADLPPRR